MKESKVIAAVHAMAAVALQLSILQLIKFPLRILHRIPYCDCCVIFYRNPYCDCCVAQLLMMVPLL